MSPLCLLGRVSFWGCFFALLLQSTARRDLKSVIVVFRHGDRTPLSTFPTNPVKERAWPEGYGQLTKEGMHQQYVLGQFIRHRYKEFLDSKYRRNEVYVRSTDYDRTIMSALTNLAGLYPPIGNQIWKTDLRWQPIPVHTVPVEHEKLLVSPTRPCGRFGLLLKETIGSKETQGQLQPHMGFLAKTAERMGYDIKTLMDFRNEKLWNAYDALVVQKIHKKAMPQWATHNTIIRLKAILNLAASGMFGGTKRIEKSRLQGGILLKEILKKFTAAADSDDEPKLTMYSAHDMTLIALQSALDVYNHQLPPYAACQFFELYKEDKGKYSIEMHYRNGTNSDAFRLIMPGCTAACPLDKFKEMVSPVIPDNVEEECNKM